ncbi:hypothetical protein RND71_008292 [Anisodus tanguticus]|uniref:Uncharacterized protein n=1 Tax=Anisodus tanguticus TaxID=243964 RepID=A0AAE1VJU8_9SOLA|nr:hypothetical protein RND71_008292 [Anisodus tanguticus]
MPHCGNSKGSGVQAFAGACSANCGKSINGSCPGTPIRPPISQRLFIPASMDMAVGFGLQCFLSSLTKLDFCAIERVHKANEPGLWNRSIMETYASYDGEVNQPKERRSMLNRASDVTIGKCKQFVKNKKLGYAAASASCLRHKLIFQLKPKFNLGPNATTIIIDIVADLYDGHTRLERIPVTDSQAPRRQSTRGRKAKGKYRPKEGETTSTSIAIVVYRMVLNCDHDGHVVFAKAISWAGEFWVTPYHQSHANGALGDPVPSCKNATHYLGIWAASFNGLNSHYLAVFPLRTITALFVAVGQPLLMLYIELHLA